MPRYPTNDEAAKIIRDEIAALPGSPLGSPTPPSSTDAEVETPTDSHSEDGTKKQA